MKKNSHVVVFGEPDRPASMYRVMASDHRFVVVSSDFSKGIAAAMEHLDASTSDELPKPFAFELVGEHTPIDDSFTNEILVVLQ